MTLKPPEAVRLQVNSSALHVFDVLRVVCAAPSPIGVSELARRLALPTTTVHRALITLEDARYIRRPQNSTKYEPGLMAQLLASTLFKRFRLSEASLPFLRRLAAETGETASLTARLGWYGLRIAVAYGGNDIHHRDRLGETNLLHRNLSGKGIFAFLGGDESRRYRRFARRRHPEVAFELDDASLQGGLDTARADGWVGEKLDLSPGSLAVAFPVRDLDGAAVAAITINGPVLSAGNAATLPAGLKAIRDELEALIGRDAERYRSPYAHLDPDQIALRLPEERGG